MSMQITLKDIKAGKAIQLDVHPEDTAAAVKAKVEAQEGIQASQQRIIFRGKTLGDGQTLRELGVQKGAMLHLVLKLASSQPVEVKIMTGQLQRKLGMQTSVRSTVLPEMVQRRCVCSAVAGICAGFATLALVDALAGGCVVSAVLMTWAGG